MEHVPWCIEKRRLLQSLGAIPSRDVTETISGETPWDGHPASHRSMAAPLPDLALVHQRVSEHQRAGTDNSTTLQGGQITLWDYPVVY